MPKPYRPAEVVRVLESFGWMVRRRESSHVIMNKQGVRVNIAVPSSKREVAIGTFKAILRDAGISQRQFDERAREVL